MMSYEKEIRVIFNYLTNDIKGLERKTKIKLRDTRLTPALLAQVASLFSNGKISSREAKDMITNYYIKY